MLKYLRMGNKRTKAIWWTLIVVTIVTFVGGFIFLFGAGIDSGMQARATGAMGTVNGEPITRLEYQSAIEEQRAGYRQRFGVDPTDQDQRLVEAQAWRAIVNQRVMEAEARKLGLTASDKEVVYTLQTSPPQMLATAPDFQTNGQFDINKYMAALRNPGNNWAPFEEMVRRQLPLRKLQERLLSSVKLSEPELNDALRNRFETLSGTIALVAPSTEGNVPAATDADLDRVYQRHRGRFSVQAGMQLEVLQVVKKYDEEAIRTAREQAQSLANRARQGESFATLARDYSEGPGAERGGEIQRVFQLSEFSTDMATKLAVLDTGGVSDPIQEGGRFMVFKVLERVSTPGSPTPGLRLAQILVKARSGDEQIRAQVEQLQRIRSRATRLGLGRAATEEGLATSKTGFFNLEETPPQLFSVPDLADWAMGSKVGAVSPMFEGMDEFIVAQVSDRREGGPAPKEAVMAELRQLAEFEARTALAKPKADAMVASLARGATLEAAAQQAGVSATTILTMSRMQPDPRVAPSPELIGAMFTAPIGRVIGPVETPTGWYFARVDTRVPPDTSSFAALKGQVTNDILSRKQQDFFAAWLTEQRQKTKVQDLRQP